MTPTLTTLTSYSKVFILLLLIVGRPVPVGTEGSKYDAQIMAEMRHRERERMRKYAAAQAAAAGAGAGSAYADPALAAAAAARYASARQGAAAAGGASHSRSMEAREHEARAYAAKMRQIQHAKMLQNAQRNEKQRFHTQTLPRREREMLQAAYYQQQGERVRRGDEHAARDRVHMSAVEKVPKVFIFFLSKYRCCMYSKVSLLCCFLLCVCVLHRETTALKRKRCRVVRRRCYRPRIINNKGSVCVAVTNPHAIVCT